MSRVAGYTCGIMLGAVLFVALGGAQTPPKKKTTPAPDSKPTANLEGEIRHQLQVAPFYSVFDYIDFALRGSTVTLTGQVIRPTLKTAAETAIGTLEGVEAVVNQIEVLPASAADDDLRNDLYRSIYEDPSLAKYAVHTVPSIHILVKNGNVTLEGSVDSRADKLVAGTRASAVANIRTVTNNLIVRAKSSAAE